MRRLGIIAFCVALVFTGDSFAQSAVHERGYEAPLGYVTTDVPAVLSADDVALYKKLFRLQKARQRSQVARHVGQIENDILMGHLIAVRLVHPNTRVPYADTKEWLSKYNDHYQAKQIYEMANRKRPRGSKESWHKRPANMKAASFARYSDPDERPQERVQQTSERKQMLRKLRYYRIKQYYTKSMETLAQPRVKRLLGDETWAQVATKLAHSMMRDGYLEKADRTARMVVNASEQNQPQALWIAGFSAYRLGQKEKAVNLFRRLAYSVPPNSKYYAQAAWWAAKTYEDMGRDSMGRVFLNLAVQDPYSFYGRLAVERLDKRKLIRWESPQMQVKDKTFLMNDPAVRRVIALAQIGEYGMAQQELKTMYSRVPYDMDESLLALSLQLHLPNAAMTLARNLQERGHVYLEGTYPVVGAWKPRGGFQVSEALMHAIMRQESAFNPEIKSRAGARGLMQLMPSTAKYIRHKQGRPVYSRYALNFPSINMMLGQDYLQYLDEKFEGNLVHMVASYNAGPGNVNKWIERGLAKQDPIVFIESIPFDETRKYVKRVMANLWMYKSRFGEETATLTAMAWNRWPNKVALADQTRQGG